MSAATSRYLLPLRRCNNHHTRIDSLLFSPINLWKSSHARSARSRVTEPTDPRSELVSRQQHRILVILLAAMLKRCGGWGGGEKCGPPRLVGLGGATENAIGRESTMTRPRHRAGAAHPACSEETNSPEERDDLHAEGVFIF